MFLGDCLLSHPHISLVRKRQIMTCFHPHKAYQAIGVKNPETGRKIIRYSGKGMVKLKLNYDPGYEVYKYEGDVYDYRYKPVNLPCNNCIGCRIERARQWSLRNYHEASVSSSACFITLTFGDEATIDNVFRLDEFKNLSRNRKFEEARKRINTLVRGDFSRFIKRLRKILREGYYYYDELGRKQFYQQKEGLRFYACGEYGELNERPHYHALIYNFDFPGKQYIATQDGHMYWTHPVLEKAWGYGFVYISDFTINTASYVSRYVTKKINGRLKDEWYQGKEPEYQVCSNRPGIGRKWFEQHMSDVYPTDEVIFPAKSGKKIKMKPPKYYDNLYDKFAPDDFEQVKAVRELWIQNHEKLPSFILERSPERLSVKEEVLRLRVKKLVRVLERSQFTNYDPMVKILAKCNEYGIPYEHIRQSRGDP